MLGTFFCGTDVTWDNFPKTNTEIEDSIEMNVNQEELKFVKKKPGDTCKASLEKKDLSIVNTFRLVLNTLQNGLKYFLMDNF